MKLQRDFYIRKNVLEVAEDLLGKVLFTRINNKITAGIITETEAYAGITDRASHAFSGRRTARTEIMYAEGGVSYVYLCYGIHHLFNVVTAPKNIPHAVLIRSIIPYSGIDTMLKRRNKEGIDKTICNGPGTTAQALGIKTIHSGIDLSGSKIWIEHRGIKVLKSVITRSPRIGVDYAGADALLPYRFVAEI